MQSPASMTTTTTATTDMRALDLALSILIAAGAYIALLASIGAHP